jgi:branched-subunit amino acid aminotransferase/4-amino-4-deoxychorismate lyase
MELRCFLNGKIIPLSEGKVGVYDVGLLRGFGIYEGLASHNRKPFMFADHMERFHASAQRMEMLLAYSDAQIEQAITELIANNVPEGKEALIRIIQTGGPAIDGIAYDPATPTFYILVEEFVPIEERFVQDGCAIATLEHLRQFPELKSINYIQAVLLQRRKREEKIVEVLYVWQGRALECTGSNVFIVQNGKILTPGRDVILGITRKVAMTLAKKEFPLEERDISLEELLSADEVFITGSFKEIVPVVSVDKHQIGDGTPGPVSERVIELFREFAKDY